MKKNLYLFSVILLILSSCSKDENISSKSASSILVKKIIHTYSPNDVVTLNYKYDGNKIVSESDNQGFVSTYTYIGNVISKIEERVNDKFQRSIEYTYTDGKVSNKIEKTNHSGTRSFTYTHNSNSSVSYISTRNGSAGETGMYTIENGNIVKNEVFSSNINSTGITYKFAYDTMKNPFNNILGFNLILDPDHDTFSKNNMTEDGAGIPTFYFTYKYNENGYPTDKKYSSSESAQYFY
jgi:hypothetical protein